MYFSIVERKELLKETKINIKKIAREDIFAEIICTRDYYYLSS